MKETGILISLFILGFLFGCKSNQKDALTSDQDSLKIALTKKENQIGVFTPPDSNYTGDYFEKYPDGLVKVRGNFRFGKKSGKWMYFYPDGKLWSEAFFKDNQMNGESNVYHPNGQLYYSGFYKMDIADSVWKFYDSTGVLVETRTYPEKKNK